VPASTATETWQRKGPEVFVERAGPAPDGTKYADGKHSIRVACFECEEDARLAVEQHNAALTSQVPYGMGDIYF
jgi:hypothetical protein